MVSSWRNRDIEEQEAGVELALKLPQIASIVNYARGRRRQTALFYGFDSAARNDIFRLYTIAGLHQRAPDISLQI